MMSTRNSSNKAHQLREKQATELENANKIEHSRGSLIIRSAIESEKKKKQSANGMRRNNAMKVRTRQ
jgi:hypothetical protein